MGIAFGRLKLYHTRAVALLAGCGMWAFSAGSAWAVEFVGSNTSPGVWTYTLTYNSEDNYSITQPSTTITVNDLVGVTGASGPTSTDFPDAPGGYLDTLNLQWVPQVLGGGTSVAWTHVGGGTGNFPGDQHVFGFQIFAPGGIDGLAHVVTSGFSTDTSGGSQNRDINTYVSGPTGIGSSTPEPASVSLGVGGGLVLLMRRRRWA